MQIVRTRHLTVPDLTDREILEMAGSVQRITCRQRSFTEITKEMLRIHFVTMEDAMSFFETFCYLLERVSKEQKEGEGVIEDEVVAERHAPLQIRARLNPEAGIEIVDNAKNYLQAFACGLTAWSGNEKNISEIWFQKLSDLDMLKAVYPGLIREVKMMAR